MTNATKIKEVSSGVFKTVTKLSLSNCSQREGEVWSGHSLGLPTDLKLSLERYIPGLTSIGVPRWVATWTQWWQVVLWSSSRWLAGGRAAEHLLGGVGQVEKAILILVVTVQLLHGDGHVRQPFVVHQQVEGLGGGQAEPRPAERKVKTACG